MKTITTLTMNPTIDLSYEVDRVQPTRKTRADNERYAPGGGGINVARVFVRLGGNARCIYLSGGATGPAFDGLVDQHQLVRERIPIAGSTRIATAVFERETGQEYRFTPSGPQVSEDEWQHCLERLAEVDCDYLVASGSLPPGVPVDFYARAAAIMAKRGIAMVLDTSGPALSHAVADANLLLIKPNLAEFQQLVGSDITGASDIVAAAKAIVHEGQSRFVAITIGDQGALLVSEELAISLPALPIEAKSAVGAGDSFLAAMVHALAKGSDPAHAFKRGMAAGSAAVLTPGSNLAYPDEIDRLFAMVAPG